MRTTAPFWIYISRRFQRDHAETVYMAAKGALERKAWMPSTRAAIALAVLVHAICLAFPIALFWSVLRGPWYLGVVAFMGCAVIGLALRKMISNQEKVLERSEAPQFYAVLDEVRVKTGHRETIELRVSSDFNAFYTRSLWGKPTITLGLPLMYILNAQERISLVSHEVAHGVNGDVLRSSFLSFPLTLFATWYELLVPDGLMLEDAHIDGGANPVQAVYNVFLYLLSYIPLGLLKVFHRLTMPDSQLAEYRADFIQAKVAGKAAAMGLLDKTHFGGCYVASLHKQTLNPEQPHLYAEFAQQMASRSLIAVEEVRQEYRSRATSLDSHPPTLLRMRFLEEVGPEQGILELTEERNTQLSAELEQFIPSRQREAIENYRMAILH
jgi:heat shock protein HtpX